MSCLCLLPDLRILILTMYDNEQYFFESLKAGASGYVLKSVADRDLVEACRAAMRGEPFLYPGAVTALVRNYLEWAKGSDNTPRRPSPTGKRRFSSSSPRATHPNRSPTFVHKLKTVERHRANLLQKLGLRVRLELTRYAIRAGLIEP